MCSTRINVFHIYRYFVTPSFLLAFTTCEFFSVEGLVRLALQNISIKPLEIVSSSQGLCGFSVMQQDLYNHLENQESVRQF